MWSNVGVLHLKKGQNRFAIEDLREGAEIDAIFTGIYPPFPEAALLSVPASEARVVRNSPEGTVKTIPGLGFRDGVTVLPFDTPSYTPETAPAVEFDVTVPEGASALEVLSLANLHVYEGRDARYAVSIDGGEPAVFSIHAEDFSAQWRWNVLRGYAVRSLDITPGRHRITVALLDPGIVLQEIRLRP